MVLDIQFVMRFFPFCAGPFGFTRHPGIFYPTNMDSLQVWILLMVSYCRETSLHSIWRHYSGGIGMLPLSLFFHRGWPYNPVVPPLLYFCYFSARFLFFTVRIWRFSISRNSSKFCLCLSGSFSCPFSHSLQVLNPSYLMLYFDLRNWWALF